MPWKKTILISCSQCNQAVVCARRLPYHLQPRQYLYPGMVHPTDEKLVCKIIRPKKNTDEDDFRLRFHPERYHEDTGNLVLEAQKEIHCFAERIQRMFGMVKELLGETNDEKFVKLYSRIEIRGHLRQHGDRDCQISRPGERFSSF